VKYIYICNIIVVIEELNICSGGVFRMVEKGTTLYKLNRNVEERGKQMVDAGFHNTMSDLVEHAVFKHILYLESLVKGGDR